MLLTTLRETALRAGLTYGGERWERIFVARHIPRNIDVVELGTSIGELAAFAVHRMVANARYVGVEIDGELIPEATKRLRRATRDSGRWQIINGAVGVYPHDRVGVYRPGRHDAGGAMPGDEAKAYRLSEVLAEGGIRGEYALIMDIEGSECGVITHDADALANCRVIVAELHDCGAPTHANPNSMPRLQQIARLEALGFRLVDQPRNQSTVCAFKR